ncbi:MAG: response regulator [Calditrichaeota bacterium]|nr:response regulator [Calditrichota bacterium]
MAEERKPRILYMEDDPGLARLFERKMAKLDYEIVLARDGQEGLQRYVEEGPFDILLVDYQMPVYDGLQVLRKLPEGDARPGVIMLTGAGNEEVAVEAMKMGALDYLQKDLDGRYFQLLPVVIDEAVKRTRLEQEKRRMQAELKRYAAELERSNKELQQFAYVVSHDLKEPLHTIRGFAKFLEENCGAQLDAQSREFLGYIMEGSQRMERLIEGLLDYSRVKFNELKLTRVESEKLVKQVIQDLKSTISRRNAQITYDTLPTIQGNERMLLRLFQNLIDNAIKYCREAVPQVHISAEKHDGVWEFGVRDNGIGIDPKHAERIFIIFQRLHSANEFAGDGLGLAICKKIVENHKGEIWVKSRRGKGSTFYFTIPDKENAHQ